MSRHIASGSPPSPCSVCRRCRAPRRDVRDRRRDHGQRTDRHRRRRTGCVPARHLDRRRSRRTISRSPASSPHWSWCSGALPRRSAGDGAPAWPVVVDSPPPGSRRSSSDSPSTRSTQLTSSPPSRPTSSSRSRSRSALGYWLLVGAGAVGIVVFFASTNDAFGDRRDGLNPWIAALGALAVVVATAGPLLPDRTRRRSATTGTSIERPGEPPAMLVAMRLVQLGLFALGGVIGFLSVRRWGLGVAVGATLPASGSA